MTLQEAIASGKCWIRGHLYDENNLMCIITTANIGGQRFWLYQNDCVTCGNTNRFWLKYAGIQGVDDILQTPKCPVITARENK